jgi:O-antigen ligase
MSPARGAARRWGRSSSWDVFPTLEDESSRDSNDGRVVDFFLFATMPMSYFQVRGLPASELAAGLVVGLALLRKPRVRSTPWLTLGLLGLLGLMLLSAQLNGASIDPGRRLLHLTLYVALALTAAQGRFHTRSMAKGFAVGLLVSVGAYYAGYGTGYPGRLAGLMADPNSAGYILSTLGCLALAGLGTSRWRVPLGLLLATCVVLTYSRTSMLALVLIVLWVAIGRRLAASLGSVLLIGMIWIVTNVPVSLQTFGPFSDRSGSDALRRRIVRLEHLQISEAPWYGHGPGTSWVDVQGDRFLFHNSYLAIHNEAGRVGQLLILVIGVLALVALLRLRPALRNPWYEAALIAVAVCAVNLGEVLLELPAALALGLAAYYAMSVRDAPPDDDESASAFGPLETVRLR